VGRRRVAIPELVKTKRVPKAILEFPIIVCSSFEKIFAVDFFTGSSPLRIEENFQLEVDYAYFDKNGSQKSNYFLIDFVELDQLPNFVEAVSKDAEAAAFLLSE